MRIKERYIWILLSLILIVSLVVPVIAQNVPGNGTINKTENEQVNEYAQKMEDVFRFLKQNYVEDVDPEQLFIGAVKGMMESLEDPYTYYLSKDDMRSLMDATTGEFGGLGLYISKPEPGSEASGQLPFVKIVSPIEDTPAYRTNILPGDYIVKIEDESTEKMTIDDVLDKLRGKAGTDVRISILRGKDIAFDVTITRAEIVIPTVKHAMLDNSTGYMRIIQFTEHTPEKVQEALSFFKKNHYKALIIDVRNNPGGLLRSVVKISDFFLSEGVIVSTRSRIKSRNAVYNATGWRTIVPKKLKIVVLINKGSASASEILAGALKDTKRGVLLGETSYGKGSVQQIQPLGEGGFKYTVSKYYTPSGTNINKIGIKPNIIVKEDEFTEEEIASYKILIEENLVEKFVNKKKRDKISASDINNFIKELRNKKIVLRENVLKRLIKNEINKYNKNPPVFDLEYDIVLQKALEVIEKKR